MATAFDYIIAGGGLSGCVLASRLKQAFPTRSIALIETGSDSRSDPTILNPGGAWMQSDKRYYLYNTLPQKSLNNRTLPLKTGNALGGGSAVNYGGWTRGDRDGYDEWGKMVGDSRWSYEGLLPFFKKSETFPLKGREAVHGYSGPIKPSKGDRGYPLKGPVKDALLEAGLAMNEDGNGGDFLGIVPLVESWNGDRRTFAATEYDLTGVEILFETRVDKVLIENARATGVLLSNGKILTATREVIISCGAIRTPQLLMLSGIGPKDQLEQFNIPVVLEAPAVGKNLNDHPMVAFWWKLRNPEQGLALGAPKFMANPKFFEGNAMDWMVNASAPEAEKIKAAEIDGREVVKRRDDIELVAFYAASPSSPYEAPPMDGTSISLSAVGMSVTSRGEVTLASADPKDLPLVDPAYLSTAHDRAVMRAGVRLVLGIAQTPAWQKISTGEVPPGPFSASTLQASDEELDARCRATAVTCYHYASTAAMGEVVDTECRVKGVEGLRVVDTSIIPLSIAAHLQAVMYGVAERAAQMIIDSDS